VGVADRDDLGVGGEPPRRDLVRAVGQLGEGDLGGGDVDPGADRRPPGGLPLPHPAGVVVEGLLDAPPAARLPPRRREELLPAGVSRRVDPRLLGRGLGLEDEGAVVGHEVVSFWGGWMTRSVRSSGLKSMMNRPWPSRWLRSTGPWMVYSRIEPSPRRKLRMAVSGSITRPACHTSGGWGSRCPGRRNSSPRPRRSGRPSLRGSLGASRR